MPKLIKPFKGDFPITQKFGENPDNYKRFGLAGHEGVDWGLPLGTEILAPLDGELYVGWSEKDYGLFYVIENDWGSVWLAHLLENFLPAGSKVVQGQLIGKSGNSGNSTGPHLHLSLKVKGISNPAYKDFIDPMPYFSEQEQMFTKEEYDAAMKDRNDYWQRYEAEKKLREEVETQYQGIKTACEEHQHFIDALWEMLNPLNKEKNTANILGEVKELVEKEKTFQEKEEEFKKTLQKQQETIDTSEKEVARLLEGSQGLVEAKEKLELALKEKEELVKTVSNEHAKILDVIFDFVKGKGGEIVSNKFSLNAQDLNNWVRNTIIFLAPALLALFASIQGSLPKEATSGIVALYILNVLTDLLKKYVAGK